ncbi:MAG: hypothetical protein ACM3RX_06035 [Methanococcaceae archaeon]
MFSKYSDFVREHTRYHSLANDQDFKDIFDFLSKKDNIAKMLEVTKWEKPALSGCIKELEDEFPFILSWSPKDYFKKQAVGYMVKVVLEPFGYVPDIQKRIAPPLNRTFSSATVYKLVPEKAKWRLVPKWDIENVESEVPRKRDVSFKMKLSDLSE